MKRNQETRALRRGLALVAHCPAAFRPIPNAAASAANRHAATRRAEGSIPGRGAAAIREPQNGLGSRMTVGVVVHVAVFQPYGRGYSKCLVAHRRTTPFGHTMPPSSLPGTGSVLLFLPVTAGAVQ
jgi:hypothetical protein